MESKSVIRPVIVGHKTHVLSNRISQSAAITSPNGDRSRLIWPDDGSQFVGLSFITELPGGDCYGGN